MALRFGVAHTNPRGSDPDDVTPRLVTLAHGIASAFGVWTGRNRLRRSPIRHPAQVLAGRRLRRGFLLSHAERATIAALPQDIAVPGLDRARAKPMPAPVAVASGGRGTKVLGRADVGGHSVALHVVDARQHLHVLGSTGSGKSTLLMNMILDDIHARRGVVVIDPKGDLVLDLLDRIPKSHAKRLTNIDPDQPAGTTLNPLQGADHDLVVDNIVSIFGRIFAKHWGPRIDDTLRVACLTLLRKANATLTLIPPLLNDKKFRYAFTQDLDDPEGLRGYWEWFESTPPPLRAQVIGPVLSRLRAFLLRDFVRRTLGAPRSSFDMRRVLDGDYRGGAAASDQGGGAAGVGLRRGRDAGSWAGRRSDPAAAGRPILAPRRGGVYGRAAAALIRRAPQRQPASPGSDRSGAHRDVAPFLGGHEDPGTAYLPVRAGQVRPRRGGAALHTRRKVWSQVEHRLLADERGVEQPTLVAAVDPPRRGCAQRAGGSRGG